jgi:DNA ligase (NAD+)
LERVLNALSIRHIGVDVSRKLAAHYKTLSAIQNTTVEELASMYGMGLQKAKAIHEYFQTPWREAVLDGWISAGLVVLEKQEVSNKLAGYNILFTGKLQSLSRQDAKELALQNGAEVSSSVGAKTNLLVVGEKAPAHKVKKAEERGINIMDEETFLEMLK